MLSFEKKEYQEIVYGVYSNVSSEVMPVFFAKLEQAFNFAIDYDRATTSASDHVVIKLKWSQAKLIYEDALLTLGKELFIC